MSSLLRQFGIVMWKNFKLKQRHWVVTLFEMLVSPALFILLVILRAQVVYDAASTPARTFG